jgi:VWFA-related protein
VAFVSDDDLPGVPSFCGGGILVLSLKAVQIEQQIPQPCLTKERPMSRFYLLLCGLALFCLSADSLPAQDGKPEDSSAPLRLNARTVVEDVVVIDKNGHAVPSLRKGDFQVFENGKPQVISFFESNFAAAETPAASPAALPPDTFTNIPVTTQNNVTNVLLLDALNTSPTEQMYAKVQMIKYLAALPPNLRIGVFMLDNEKFHMIWGLDTDSFALRAAIARFSAKHSRSSLPSSTAQQQSEQQELMQTATAVKRTAMDAGDDRLGESADALQDFLKQGILKYRTANGSFFTTMNALEALAHYFAGIPGRKNLFWLSSSFPHCFKSGPPCGAFFEWYRDARDKLTKAGVSVYPIDANGVDVDTGGFQSGLEISASSARFEASEGWAEETGGKAYHENDIPQEIANAADHGSRYYTLAYVPGDRKEQGRERKVEVKVLSGDYRLFYRKSYFEQTQREIAKSNAAPPTNPLLALMGRGMPDISEIPYRLRVVPAAKQPAPGAPRAGENTQLGGNVARYHIGFQLRASTLSLLPDADGARRKSLEVTLVVYSQDGKPLNWESRHVVLLIRPEQWVKAVRDGVSFHLDLDAPSGDVYLRTGVYDSTSSKVGTLEIPLSAVAEVKKSPSQSLP